VLKFARFLLKISCCCGSAIQHTFAKLKAEGYASWRELWMKNFLQHFRDLGLARPSVLSEPD
jgi:hypothetical protein